MNFKIKLKNLIFLNKMHQLITLELVQGGFDHLKKMPNRFSLIFSF